MNQLAVSLEGLTRHFKDVKAVDSLSFEVAVGEVFGLLGHNGAGKTTTIRLLNGVLGPSGGSARVLGLDPVNDGPALRRRTGILTESPSLDERLTARENLRLYAELYDVPVDQVEGRVDAMLERFDLLERGDEKAGGYSKGMKQRLALVRALLHEPELIFLDEPTSGLDPVAARGVRELIAASAREGRTVLLCTHNLVEAAHLCDRVAVLEHGRLLALGTPADLSQRIGGQRGTLEIEIDPAGGEAALSLLKGINGLTEISLDRGRLSMTGAGRGRVPQIVQALAGKGVPIYRVTPGEPSLEDVYFALHEGNHTGAGG